MSASTIPGSPASSLCPTPPAYTLDALPPEKNAGYGLVCDLDGQVLPGLKVTRVWQEHGLFVSAHPLPPDAFPPGSRVRILPNHACPTAAAHDHYFVVDARRSVVAEWPRINGW